MILDELGRGTATTDGAAIAAAVLDHLAGTIRCRGLFATHYHHISDSHAGDPNVAIKHMACKVTPAADRSQEGGEASACVADGSCQDGTGGGSGAGVEEVTFLYRLTDGSCPRSYGVNVARLAGLPESVVRRAGEVSEQVEAARKAGAGGSSVEGAGDAGGEGGVEAMEVDGAGGGGSGVPAGGAATATELLQRLVATEGTAAAGSGGLADVREVWAAARQQLAVQ